jgi:hypothetical protein
MLKAAEAMALSDAVVRESNEKRLARYEEIFNSFIADMISKIEDMILEKTKSGAYAIYGINIQHIYAVDSFSIPGCKVMEAIEKELSSACYGFTINYDAYPELFCGLDIQWN